VALPHHFEAGINSENKIQALWLAVEIMELFKSVKKVVECTKIVSGDLQMETDTKRATK